MDPKCVFISADHGLAAIYFLQTEVIETLTEGGARVVLLTDDQLVPTIQERFAHPGLTVEGFRFSEVDQYAQRYRDLQWWLNFFRRVGGSNRINTEAMDSYVDQVAVEQPNRRRIFMPLARIIIAVLKRSRLARKALVRLQTAFTPSIYQDLFEKYQPDLIVASTPGWRTDRYLLREAARAGIRTATVIVGWDNPSSYSISGAPVDYATCWSEVQKEELVLGSDWPSNCVHIGGIPTYDGYFREQWLIPREQYFLQHGLDPDRKLLSYACSFVSFSPNIQNVEALCRLVSYDQLDEPCQLLIRLHPNHFLDVHLYAGERDAIRRLAEELPYVHVVEPVPLGGSFGHYSGEDMPEKSSMMAHSDVFLTVYSTMVVETAIHNRPIISVCMDTPRGWDTPRKYSLPLSEIGNWPTHDRFRQSGAGRVVHNEAELKAAINLYLKDPQIDTQAQQEFLMDEITYLDGDAGKRTGQYLLKILDGGGG